MTTCDFFIVGAPKAATSAMYHYLKQHPLIFMPDIKEPSFFGRDLTGLRIVDNMQDYRELFHSGIGKLCGEASTWYLYSKTAAAEIYQFNPNAKIIIMLRSPVELMYSLHSQNLYNGNTENIQSFSDALVAESERKLQRRIPPGCDRVEALFYREVVKFHDQVKRYFDQFGRDSVRVIIYRDFRRDTLGEFKKTLEFLGLDSNFNPELSVVNENKHLRSPALHHLLSDTPCLVRWLGRMIPQFARHEVRDWLGSVNTSRRPRPPLDPVLKRKLQADIVDEVDKISDLLRRDLSWWYKLSAEGTSVLSADTKPSSMINI